MYDIFIVEDDAKIRGELASLLTRFGYGCKWTEDFKNVADEILNSSCHVVLLDINLPYFDGFHVCREIRAKSDIPVIIVTSRDSEVDELMSMHLGADDFITKPYNTQILLARLESIIRRVYKAEARELSCRGVSLDIARSEAAHEGRSVELTKNEARILGILMRNAGSIVSRDDIMNELWQSSEFIDDNTLTVNVNRLRARLAEIGVEDFLVTRRGQGYMV